MSQEQPTVGELRSKAERWRQVALLVSDGRVSAVLNQSAADMTAQAEAMPTDDLC
jgi:hypothetical protein